MQSPFCIVLEGCAACRALSVHEHPTHEHFPSSAYICYDDDKPDGPVQEGTGAVDNSHAPGMQDPPRTSTSRT